MNTRWTGQYEQDQLITIPLKNQDGQYVADAKTLDQLEAEGRVVFRYEGENPNGSRNNIAGITNEHGNVVGLMPHPGSTPWNWALARPHRPRRRGTFTSVIKDLLEQPEVSAQKFNIDTVAHAEATPGEEQPWAELGLKQDEFQKVVDLLGRRPPQPSWPCTRSCGASTAPTSPPRST